jgi:hypothetical protein
MRFKMKTSINNFDIIFISFDEDNADENWADLKKICPWAKRVHGIYGSDAAHKAAAESSKTERFITVDADSIVKPEFFNVTIDEELANDKEKVISWSSKNAVNGLVYGNGSLKCWTKHFVSNMRTHEESSSPKNRVEFCFENGYIQRNSIYSITYPNGSPRQAFRSGFREGVKMTLDQGLKIPIEEFTKRIYWKNLIRLLVWCSIGSDVQNGLWCIYGARLGCYITNLTDWDYINVRDFKYLNNLWDDEISPKFESYTSSTMCTRSGYCWDNDLLKQENKDIGKKLQDHLSLNIADLNEEGSKFFRSVFINPLRVEREK